MTKNSRKRPVRGSRNPTIEYALFPCRDRLVVIGLTSEGLAAVFFGEDGDLLLEELVRRFPDAEIREGGAKFFPRTRDVMQFLNNPRKTLKTRLDLQGTEFQKRVWLAVREIPAGTTVSYSELAEAIGHPKAVRAVGNACALNPLSIVIPCYRVIRRDGSPPGYTWGIPIEPILEAERKSATAYMGIPSKQ